MVAATDLGHLKSYYILPSKRLSKNWIPLSSFERRINVSVFFREKLEENLLNIWRSAAVWNNHYQSRNQLCLNYLKVPLHITSQFSMSMLLIVPLAKKSTVVEKCSSKAGITAKSWRIFFVWWCWMVSAIPWKLFLAGSLSGRHLFH